MNQMSYDLALAHTSPRRIARPTSSEPAGASAPSAAGLPGPQGRGAQRHRHAPAAPRPDHRLELTLAPLQLTPPQGDPT